MKTPGLQIVSAFLLLSCAHLGDPRVEFMAGWPVGESVGDCRNARWVHPVGRVSEICLDPASRIPVVRRDLFGTRLADADYDNGVWYWVTAFPGGELRRRMEAAVQRDLPQSPRPYAVLIDGEVSMIEPNGFVGFSLYVTATQELGRAEQIASLWEAPVVRAISHELDNEPTASVSMCEIIGDPRPWLGKRIEVTGFLGSQVLLNASEDYAALDPQAALQVVDPSEDGVLDRSPCRNRWVSIQGTFDSRTGPVLLTPVLAGITKVWLASAPYTSCWPVTDAPPAP